MRETNSDEENGLLEAVINMKYDLQAMSKAAKCVKNLQKLLIECSNARYFSNKNPPKPKDIWRWVKHL